MSDYNISKYISKGTVFPGDREEMFYYVREGFQETIISEGFCKDLLFTSEMLSAEVKIDGHTSLHLQMGDRFKCTMDP